MGMCQRLGRCLIRLSTLDYMFCNNILAYLIVFHEKMHSEVHRCANMLTVSKSCVSGKKIRAIEDF